MTTKPNRHAMIETTCQLESCGIRFVARKDRIEKGQSRFCSREHYQEWLKAQGSQRKNIGKENAIIQWDKSKNMYCAYWYDSEMKYHSAGWARWYWELNYGDVPDEYYASYKDNNPRNNKPENVCLKTMAEISNIGERNKGVPKSRETRKKLSISHTGKILSDEHKKHIGDSNRKKWADGMFDKVHKGKFNWRWRGGVEKGYTYDFESLRVFVRDRDNYMCQICGKTLHKKRDGNVHHIDGDKKHNEMDNLILLCNSCHGNIHAKKPAPPVIMAFRSKLEWNKS